MTNPPSFSMCSTRSISLAASTVAKWAERMRDRILVSALSESSATAPCPSMVLITHGWFLPLRAAR